MNIRAPMILPEVRQRVEPELRSGEKLIWAEQPPPHIFRKQSLGIVLFSIPWTAFSVFWMFGAAHGMQPFRESNVFSFFPLFGLPFVGIGILMFFSPLLYGRKARQTVYVITDQRVIIIEGRAFGAASVQTYMPQRLTGMSRKERADGSGDLIFEQFRERAGSGTTTVRRGFIGLEHVRDVEDLIVRTLLTGRSRTMDE